MYFRVHVYESAGLCVRAHAQCVCLCVRVRPDVSIDNSLLRPGRRLDSLKEALNKQRIETEG